MNGTSIGIETMPYHHQRAMLQQYADAGHAVFVVRDRNGSRKISLDGGRRLTVHDAMNKIERWIERKNAAHYMTGP